MGVVINRETELTLSDALPELEPPEANDRSVFLGGPVSPEGLVLIVRSAAKPGFMAPLPLMPRVSRTC